MTKFSLWIWHLLHNVKSTVKISSNFVAFLENINFKDFYPVSVRAEILKIVALLFGRNDVFIKSFQFLRTFSLIQLLNASHYHQPALDWKPLLNTNYTQVASRESRFTYKALIQKNDAIFSIYGRNGIVPWHFSWLWKVGC